MTVTTRRRALLGRPVKKDAKEAIQPLPQVSPPALDLHPKIETPLILQQPPNLDDPTLESVLDLLKRQPHIKFSTKEMVEGIRSKRKAVQLGLPSKMNFLCKKYGDSLFEGNFKLKRENGVGDYKGKWIYWMEHVAGTTIERQPTPIEKTELSPSITEPAASDSPEAEPGSLEVELEHEMMAPPMLSPPLEIKDDESIDTSDPLSPVSPPQVAQCTVDELVYRPCNDWRWVWADAEMSEVYHPPEEITLMELDEMLGSGF